MATEEMEDGRNHTGSDEAIQRVTSGRSRWQSWLKGEREEMAFLELRRWAQ